MKLLLDEMLSPAIASQLRERGHDVDAVAGSVYAEMSDPDVLALARLQRRALVTNNVRDFRPLHVAAVQPGGDGHFGLIFMAANFRRSKADIGSIVDALEIKLRQHSAVNALADAEDWL